MENNRNFLITIILSVLILTLWQVFYMNPRIEAQREAARIEQQRVEAEKKAAGETTPGASDVPAAPGSQTPPGGVPGTDAATAVSREAAVAATQRVKIDTPSLIGSINLTGGRLDDLKLKQYRETVEPNSPEIELLNPQALPNGFFAETGYVGAADAGAMPSGNTVWSVDGNATLTPTTPVTLVLHQRQGPDLQAHLFGRQRLHVYGDGYRHQWFWRCDLAVELWPRNAPRQAEPCIDLRSARRPHRRDR